MKNECHLFLRWTKRTGLFTALPPHHVNNEIKIRTRINLTKNVFDLNIFFFLCYPVWGFGNTQSAIVYVSLLSPLVKAI